MITDMFDPAHSDEEDVVPIRKSRSSKSLARVVESSDDEDQKPRTMLPKLKKRAASPDENQPVQKQAKKRKRGDNETTEQQPWYKQPKKSSPKKIFQFQFKRQQDLPLGTFLCFVEHGEGKTHRIRRLHEWTCECSVKVTCVSNIMPAAIMKHLQSIDHLVWEVDHHGPTRAKLFGNSASVPNVVAPLKPATKQSSTFSQIPLNLESIIARGGGGSSSKPKAEDIERVADDVIRFLTVDYPLSLEDLVILIAPRGKRVHHKSKGLTLRPLFGLLVGKGLCETITDENGTTRYKGLDVAMAQVEERIRIRAVNKRASRPSRELEATEEAAEGHVRKQIAAADKDASGGEIEATESAKRRVRELVADVQAALSASPNEKCRAAHVRRPQVVAHVVLHLLLKNFTLGADAAEFGAYWKTASFNESKGNVFLIPLLLHAVEGYKVSDFVQNYTADKKQTVYNQMHRITAAFFIAGENVGAVATRTHVDWQRGLQAVWNAYPSHWGNEEAMVKALIEGGGADCKEILNLLVEESKFEDGKRQNVSRRRRDTPFKSTV